MWPEPSPSPSCRPLASPKRQQVLEALWIWAVTAFETSQAHLSPQGGGAFSEGTSILAVAQAGSLQGGHWAAALVM